LTLSIAAAHVVTASTQLEYQLAGKERAPNRSAG
jgi:hypothetical protein